MFGMFKKGFASLIRLLTAWKASKTVEALPRSASSEEASIRKFPQVARGSVAGGLAPPVAPAGGRTLLDLASALQEGRMACPDAPASKSEPWGCPLPEDLGFLSDDDDAAAAIFFQCVRTLRRYGTEMFFVSWTGAALEGGSQTVDIAGRQFEFLGELEYTTAREKAQPGGDIHTGTFIQCGAPAPIKTLREVPAGDAAAHHEFANQAIMLFYHSEAHATAFSLVSVASWYWAGWHIHAPSIQFQCPGRFASSARGRAVVFEVTEESPWSDSSAQTEDRPVRKLIKEARDEGAWVACLEWIGDRSWVPFRIVLNTVAVFLHRRQSLCRNWAAPHIPSGVHFLLDSRPIAEETRELSQSSATMPEALVQQLGSAAIQPDPLQQWKRQALLVVWDRDLFQTQATLVDATGA